jgi:hypothetical protein
MSDCLHCEIHEMLESHLQSEQADLAEIAARVTEVLADLILMAPPGEQTMMMADVVANLGGMVLEKCQEADPDIGFESLEVAGRHPAQVKNRQQCVEALGPPRPLRQDR